MQEHLLVMAEDDLALRRERRVRNPPPGLEPLDNLTDEPRPAVAAAADHQSVGAGFLQCPVGIVERRYVAIDNDRDGYSLLDPADEAPVG